MIDQSPSPRAAAVRGLPLGGTVLALRAAEQDVLVELGALTFCDCAGLDAPQDVARAAEAAGVPLAFRGQSEQLQWLERAVPASGRGSRRTFSAFDLPGSTARAPC